MIWYVFLAWFSFGLFEETQFMGICLDPLKGKITANEYKLEFLSYEETSQCR